MWRYWQPVMCGSHLNMESIEHLNLIQSSLSMERMEAVGYLCAQWWMEIVKFGMMPATVSPHDSHQRSNNSVLFFFGFLVYV